MAYWWVSQKQTYRHERAGGFLRAPNRKDAGLTPFHWATMNEVRPGDVIFSYVGGRIVAVAVARTAAYDSPRPGGLGASGHSPAVRPSRVWWAWQWRLATDLRGRMMCSIGLMSGGHHPPIPGHEGVLRWS